VLAIGVSNDVRGHSRAAVRPGTWKAPIPRPRSAIGVNRTPPGTSVHKSGQRNPPSLQASQPRISTQVPGQTPRPESNSDKPETLDHYCRKVLLTYHESQRRAPLNRQLSVAQQGSL